MCNFEVESAKMAVFVANASEKISAIVYLADGQQCRCLSVPAAGTIKDLIRSMLQVQEDWDDIGSAASAGKSSNPDDYAIVEVSRQAGSEVATESFLDSDMPIQSKELKVLRRSWESTVLRQIKKRFSIGFGQLPAGNRRQSKSSKTKPKPKAKSMLQSDDYWFVSPFAKRPSRDDIRVKFVSRSHYTVTKSKQGWLEVKDGRTKSRWVVYEEDTLLFYKDSEDPEPLLRVDDVATCEFKLKAGKKERSIVKLRRSKLKIDLVCENDVMSEKWLSAIRQGKSGNAASDGGIQLKQDVVEMIPELTEEEEEAEIRAALSMRQMMAKARGDGDDTYLTLEDLEGLNDDGNDVYMTTEDLDYIMVNPEGDYLTLDAMRGLAEDAGYLSVDEMQRLAKPDGAYLTVEEMQHLAQDAGYLTATELRAQMAAS
eukprot:m.221308 g.221308  ORF g.221308 m.221308 type:complete len:427 (+) comp17246_c0_seq2:4981-6261(+)